MNHRFTGPAFTIGIEEELMIVDAESLELVNAVEALLAPTPAGEIKPELMESVLEVSTDPCRNTAEAGEQLRALRRQVAATAAARGLAIRSVGTHPVRNRVPARSLARRLLDRMRDHCRDLGSLDELEAVDDLLERGNGAARQVVVYEANHDLREVVAEIVAAAAVADPSVGDA